MRGQTLGRSMYGLMEMREALVDMVYQELKAFYSKDFVDVDYYPPTERARYDDVLAWIQRNRTLLFSSRALGMEVCAALRGGWGDQVVVSLVVTKVCYALVREFLSQLRCLWFSLLWITNFPT